VNIAQAYQYTDLLSCMLLDAYVTPFLSDLHLTILLSWAIPVCMLFSYLYMRPKYHWTQLLVGILLVFTCNRSIKKDFRVFSSALLV
jgi:solute carrier family 35 protein F1/2